MSNTDFDTNAIPGTASEPVGPGDNGFTVIAGAAKPAAQPAPSAPAPATVVPPAPPTPPLASPGAPVPTPSPSPPAPITPPDMPVDQAPTDEIPFITGATGMKMLAARNAGLSWDAINGALEDKIGKARAGGISDDAINGALGWDQNAAQNFDNFVKAQAATHFAANPPQANPTNDGSQDSWWDALVNGFQTMASAQALEVVSNPQHQAIAAKQYPDIFRQIIQGMGATADAIPLILAQTTYGTAQGAGVGGAIGAVASAPVGEGLGAGPGIGAVAGGIIGGTLAFGAALTEDNAVRDSIARYSTSAPPASLQDAGTRFVMTWLQAAKEAAAPTAAYAAGATTLPLVAAAGLTGAVGAGVGWTAAATAQAATMTLVAAGMNGRAPTGQDWADGVISVLAMEVAGRALPFAVKGATALDAATGGKVSQLAGDIASGKPAPVAKIEPATVASLFNDLRNAYVQTGENPAAIMPRIAHDASLDGLKQRATQLGIKVSPEVENRFNGLNADGTPDPTGRLAPKNLPPAVRARWFNSAVKDGPDVADDIARNSVPKVGDKGVGGAGASSARWAAQFNVVREIVLKNDALVAAGGDTKKAAQSLRKQFPNSQDGRAAADITGDSQAFDSRPPVAPEVTKAAIDAQKLPAADLVKSIRSKPAGGAVSDLAYNMNRVQTRAKATDTILRQLAQKLAPKLKVAPADGSFATLDAKFDAHSRDPSSIPLTPEETRTFNETLGPLYDMRASLAEKVKGYLDQGESVEGKTDPIPFYTNRMLRNTSQGTRGSALANVMNGVAELSNVVEFKTQTDAIISSDEFKAHSTVEGDINEGFVAPRGKTSVPGVTVPYIRINASPYKGLLVDARIAEPINDYLSGGPGASTSKAMAAVNHLAIGALFTLEPGGAIAHVGKNLFETWLPARGFDNILRTPKFGRAIQEVMGLGPEYIKVMQAGGSVLGSAIHADSLIGFINSAVGNSIGKDVAAGGPWAGFAKALGVKSADFMNMWSTGMSKAIYTAGDVLYMQRYLELRDKGASVEQAIHDTELFMPTYRMPSRVLGMRWPSQVLGSMNITAFGRYTVSKFTAIANEIKTLVDPKASYEGRTAAVGRLAVTTLMMTVGQAYMNSLMQQITGNENASFGFGGPLGIVEKGAKFLEGPTVDNFSKLLSTMFTPAPLPVEAFSQIWGRDSFTGKDIVAADASPTENLSERAAHLAQGLNLSGPLTAVGNIPGYAADPMSALTDFGDYVGKTMGMSNPSAASANYRPGRAALRAAAIQRMNEAPWQQFVNGIWDDVIPPS